MAGVLKVDSINADSNLALKIANTAVAFIDSSGLRPVSGNVSLDATATSKVFLPSANTVAIQTAGVTGLSMSSSQVITLANALPVGSGGTGNTATPTAGGIVYGTGTVQAITAAGSSGQFLQSNGASAPSWATVSGNFTLISTQSGSGANNVTWSGLSGSTNYLLVLSGLADTTANRDTRIRIGTGGTILTSGYASAGLIYSSGGAAPYNDTGAGLILSLTGSYLRYFYGFIYITQPPDYSAVNFNGATNDNTYATFGNVITGAVPTSAIISDIRVYSTNNFNFGSAALYKMSV